MIHVVCVRVGTKYGPEYVARLVDMVARNASLKDLCFWCVTDAPDELPAGVNAIAANPELPGWWQKVWLFSAAMPWDLGDRIAYFDLDLAITGRLEDLLEHKGIIRDWMWPCYNSSVMVWAHGEHPAIWDFFTPEVMSRPGPLVPPDCLPEGQVNGGDQEWITDVSERTPFQHWPLFPRPWCVSYRDCPDWPATDAKVISFNGALKPHMVTEGWVPQVWKLGGYTSLPEMDGANVTPTEILDNVRANIERSDVPWFQAALGPHAARTQVAVVVAGGPSMLDCIEDIRAHKRRGARIITVNNAWRVLAAAKIQPDTHIMLDARPENAAFVQDAPRMRYLLASQCHPDVFDALADRDVVLWHNGFGDNAALQEALGRYWQDGPDQRPCVLVPGGGTVGLRALWLCFFSGYRKIHIYGMDSSYAGDVHHAYPQTLNDADQVQTVALRGRQYRCARWMVRQAEEFRQHWHDLGREGVRLFVHGRGLIPDLARLLREQERAA